MKTLIPFCLIAVFFFSCQQPADKKPEQILEELESDTVVFDSIKAQALGADSYGMKTYVMAFLKAGPDRSQDSAEAMRLQRAHLDNIKQLAAEGKLVLAGPFLDNSSVRGIYIFNVSSLEEAQEIASSDPAVKAGRLVLEIHPWYGSAALQEVNKMHLKIARKPI